MGYYEEVENITYQDLPTISQNYFRHRHFVFRQCTSFIGTYYCRTSWNEKYFLHHRGGGCITKHLRKKKYILP